MRRMEKKANLGPKKKRDDAKTDAEGSLLLEVHVIRPLPSPRQVQSTTIQPWYGFSHVSPTT